MSNKIVIIDDEVHIRALLEQTLEELEDHGIDIITAADGEAGLAAVRQHQPDVVFLDVMMPKMNGYEVCAAIKGFEETEQTFVVLLTARGQATDRDRGDTAGADLFMTKPFDPDEILSTARIQLGLG